VKNSPLVIALRERIWIRHKRGDEYNMINQDGSKDPGWKIAYYPIFQDGRTGETYTEPRALVEKPYPRESKFSGNDLREMPLRYIEKIR
jgi:hypothetical protein